MKSEFIYRLIQAFFVRGSPSLVGRRIANPMFARTRGFKSPSPRHMKIKFNRPLMSVKVWDEEKLKKLLEAGQKTRLQECVPNA